MQTSKGSFAQRMASMASMASAASTTSTGIENWDDDAEFQGELFANSTSTVRSMSSRLSIRSESNTGDDDWQVLVTPDDDLSTRNAIKSATQAGIPIPKSVPSTALLGGSIKRLGKRKSNRKVAVDDDWGQDLELPMNANGTLELKPPVPRTPADDQDDFDDWGEGSLGIRFAGTRREARGGRGSSVSAMSPSMGSCMTLESEEDDITGLVLPNEPLDFNARLEKLTKTEHPTPDVSPKSTQKRLPPPTSAPAPQLAPSLFPPPSDGEFPLELDLHLGPDTKIELKPELKPSVEHKEEDFFDGLDIGTEDALDTNKLTLNPKLVVKKQPSKKLSIPTASRPATTITFTDKPSVSRIPRPLPSTRSKLTPVYESGASTTNSTRQMPTTTSAQLLRAKRSAPVLRSNYGNVARAPVPFLPAGSSNAQSHHVMSKGPQGHYRRDSDPRRPLSPAMRTHSRMSTLNFPETPSRAGLRRDSASTTASGREGTLKRTLSKPLGSKRVYGDGSELEIFDDLPISTTKEKQFEKHPKNTQGKTIRHLPSNSRLPMHDRMATPLPQTPRSPPRIQPDSTPRFARDTAASRIAREQRLAGTRSRGEGPIAPTQTNWKAQVAARSPHTSPTALRKRSIGQKPTLIHATSAPTPKNQKGMTYNSRLQRWEGNEEALIPFSHPNTSTTTLALTTASTPTFAPPNQHYRSHDRSHSLSHNALSSIHATQKSVSSRAVKVSPMPVPSPPRPALIQRKTPRGGVQIEGGMRFDPVKMTWLKARTSRPSDHPRPPSKDDDDEDDPFRGIEDLKDKEVEPPSGAAGTTGGTSNVDEGTFVGEEFDLGPSFIRRQQDEEKVWRAKTEKWISDLCNSGERRNEDWRWSIRNLASEGARWQ